MNKTNRRIKIITVSLYPDEIEKLNEIVKRVRYRTRSDLLREWIESEINSDLIQ